VRTRTAGTQIPAKEPRPSPSWLALKADTRFSMAEDHKAVSQGVRLDCQTRRLLVSSRPAASRTPSQLHLEDQAMKKTAVLFFAVSVPLGLLILSCQQSTNASAQGRRPAPKSTKTLIAGAPAGSITVLSFPTAQDVYIVPKGHVTRAMRADSRARSISPVDPLQVARPAVNYYVVIKQAPADSYSPDGSGTAFTPARTRARCSPTRRSTRSSTTIARGPSSPA